ncbi:MAG: hypothetical protein DHS20C21_01050 [Gemmatimonadota bacterium]|nr:MAG: hypothetical protein DHS20C21_01050 [Gemmatimonadota bacterium]
MRLSIALVLFPMLLAYSNIAVANTDCDCFVSADWIFDSVGPCAGSYGGSGGGVAFGDGCTAGAPAGIGEVSARQSITCDVPSEFSVFAFAFWGFHPDGRALVYLDGGVVYDSGWQNTATWGENIVVDFPPGTHEIRLALQYDAGLVCNANPPPDIGCDGSPYLSFSDPVLCPKVAPSAPDLAVDRVVFYQSTQTPTNSTVLVNDKLTLARAIVVRTGDPPRDWNAVLRVRYTDGSYDEIPSTGPQNDDSQKLQPSVDPNVLDRQEDTINFLLSLSASQIEELDQFEVEVNPCSLKAATRELFGSEYVPVAESDYLNNTTIVTKESMDWRVVFPVDPCYLTVSTDNEPAPSPDDDALRAGVGDYRFRLMFPAWVYPYRFVGQEVGAVAAIKTGDTELDSKALLRTLEYARERVNSSCDALFAWAPSSFGEGPPNRLGGTRSSENVSWGRNERNNDIYAHEMYHSLTNKTNADHDAPNVVTVNLGLDPRRLGRSDPGHPGCSDCPKIVMPGTASFFREVAPAGFSWITAAAVEDALPWSRTVGSVPHGVEVRGLVWPDSGVVAIGALGDVEGEPVTASDETSPLRLRAYNALGALLDDIGLPQTEVSHLDSSVFPFDAVLSSDTTAAGRVHRIEIVEVMSQTILFDRTRSASPPVATFLAPVQGLTLGDGYSIEWSATDADGDSLFHTLTYERVGSPEGRLLTYKQTTGSYTLSDAGLPGSASGEGLLRLITEDGFNRVETIVDFLTVGSKKSPDVRLLTPGGSAASTSTLVFEAAVSDPEDGRLADSTIDWSTDLVGSLGEGSQRIVYGLTPGTHVVTVSATDSDGMVASDSIVLQVEPASNDPVLPALPTAVNANATSDVGFDVTPDIASDGAGTWIAVWASTEDLGGAIGGDLDILHAQSIDGGRTWSGPDPLGDRPFTDSASDYAPRILGLGSGVWVAIWTSNDDLGGTIGSDLDILYSRSTDDGSTWSAAAPLNSTASVDTGSDGSPVEHLALSHDHQGRLIAAWTSWEAVAAGPLGADADILAALSVDAGLSWGPAFPLNTNADVDDSTDKIGALASGGSGSWVAVFVSADSTGGVGTDDDVFSTRSTDGGSSWAAKTLLNSSGSSDGTAGDAAPALATDGLGQWVAVWASGADIAANGGDGGDIFVSRSSDQGVSWSAVELLNSNGVGDTGADLGPKVAADRLGHWIAVWRSNEDAGGAWGTDADILTSKSEDGGLTWTDVQVLNVNAAHDSGTDRKPNVASNGIGDWIVVWESTDDLAATIGTDFDCLSASFFVPVPVGVGEPEGPAAAVGGIRLLGSYPNPFRQSTTIQFQLNRPAFMDVRVYNVAGRLVRRLAEGPMPSGAHRVDWDGRTTNGIAANGIYFYVVRAGVERRVGRMVLVR